MCGFWVLFEGLMVKVFEFDEGFLSCGVAVKISFIVEWQSVQ